MVFQKLKIDYPQVSVNMKIGKMESVSLMLKRGLMDVGIVVESEICDQFDKHIIRKGFFSVYAKKGVTQILDQGIYVDHTNGLFVDRLQKNYKKRFKQEMTIMQELDSWQVLAKCAENGIGHCFLPDFIVAGNSSVEVCDLIDPIPYRIVAIYPKGVHLTRATKTLLTILSAQY
jgi:DNA-binding transcriptional LysR family regulator